MKRKIMLVLASAGTFLMLTSNNIPMKPISQYLDAQISEHKTPSVQYLFFDADSILVEYRKGVSNVHSSSPVTVSTRYHLYSVTKTFTALAVMQLAQEGKIDLKKAVISYLPEFPYDPAITVEQLLSHTSGIPNPLPLRWIHLASEHAGFDRDSFFVNIFKRHPTLDFAPGTRFKYTNLGYVVLGQLVEEVSGLPFEEYIGTNIIDRSGIDRKDLNFTIDTTTHAVGYQKWFSFNNAVFTFLIDKEKFMGDREGGWKPFKPFYNNGVAYGGMFGTGQALVKYAQTLMKPASPLLSDEYKSTLFTEATVGGKGTGMANAWFTGVLNGHRYIAHAGGGGGYYVELRAYPELRVGSLVMFNRTGVKDERFLDKLDKSFLPGN